MANSAGRGSNQGPNSFFVAPPGSKILRLIRHSTDRINPPVIPYGQVTRPLIGLQQAHLPSQLTLSRSSSGTYFDSSGVIQTATSNNPRFNYKYNGASWVPAGLLIEEQRTNYSNAVTQTGNWSNLNVSVTTGVSSPDSGTNAITLVPSGSNSGHMSYIPSTLVIRQVPFHILAMLKLTATRSSQSVNLLRQELGRYLLYPGLVLVVGTGTSSTVAVSNATIIEHRRRMV